MKYKTRPCVMCGKSSTVDADRAAIDRWKGGAYIQQAFPDWSADQRELLVSGTHPECWDTLMGES
jgi:hypothetical protein